MSRFLKQAAPLLFGVGLCGLASAQDLRLEDEDAFQLELGEEFEALQLQLDQVLGNQFAGGLFVDEEEVFVPDRFGRVTPSAMTAPAHGSVKTDSDSELLLQRAEEFAKQERFDLASTLWQKVIDQSSDVLLERDEWKERTLSKHTYQTYRPMISEIESAMSELVVGGLESYQLQVDGEARATLALAEIDERESALATVIQRYFLSSLGDDAAFELGCLKMERQEFLPAVRLFSKILDEYPKTDLDLPQVQMRLAGALARVGGARQALEMVDALHAEHATMRPVLELVRKDIEQVRQASGSGARDATLTTPPGVQVPLAMEKLPEVLVPIWEQPYELRLPEAWPTVPQAPRSPLPVLRRPSTVFRNGQAVQQQPKTMPLLDRWTDQGFALAGEMIVHDGRAYFKTDDRLAVCDTATGTLQWLGFRNSFEVDERTVLGSRYTSGLSTAAPYPTSGEEHLVFGDRVHQSMTMSQGAIYALQGAPLDFTEPESEGQLQQRVVPQRGFGFNRQAGSRMRSNRLVAYEADTGRLKWYRQAMTDDMEADAMAFGVPSTGGGFARAPLPYNSLLIAPVNMSNALWLMGMDAETGKTLWRTFLCDEAPQAQSGSAVALAVDAGDVYVGTGSGFVFSLDAIAGSLNWAVRYPRTNFPRDHQVYKNTRNRRSYIDGWTQDVLYPHADKIIIGGSDFNHLFALNRRTGKLAWEISKRLFLSKNEGQTILGMRDGRLYVSASRALRCYSASGGKLLWETKVATALGRPAMTDNAIYVPQDETIIQLDPETGETVATARVHMRKNNTPVGNLFTDGERLLVSGLKRVYALGVPTGPLPDKEPEVQAAPEPQPKPTVEVKPPAQLNLAPPVPKPSVESQSVPPAPDPEP